MTDSRKDIANIHRTLQLTLGKKLKHLHEHPGIVSRTHLPSSTLLVAYDSWIRRISSSCSALA